MCIQEFLLKLFWGEGSFVCCLLYPYCGRSKTVPSLRSGGKVAYLRPSLLPPPTSRMCAQLTHLCPAAAAAAAAAEIEARAQGGRRGRGRIPATASPSIGGGRGGGGQLDLRRRIKKGKRLFGRAQDIDEGKKESPPPSLLSRYMTGDRSRPQKSALPPTWWYIGSSNFGLPQALLLFSAFSRFVPPSHPLFCRQREEEEISPRSLAD